MTSGAGGYCDGGGCGIDGAGGAAGGGAGGGAGDAGSGAGGGAGGAFYKHNIDDETMTMMRKVEVVTMLVTSRCSSSGIITQ